MQHTERVSTAAMRAAVTRMLAIRTSTNYAVCCHALADMRVGLYACLLDATALERWITDAWIFFVLRCSLLCDAAALTGTAERRRVSLRTHCVHQTAR